MRRVLSVALATVLLLALTAISQAQDDPEPIVRNGEAFLLHDPAARTWTIGNAMIEFVVGLDRDGLLRVRQLVNRLSGFDWQLDRTVADTAITLAGHRIERALDRPGRSLLRDREKRRI